MQDEESKVKSKKSFLGRPIFFRPLHKNLKGRENNGLLAEQDMDFFQLLDFKPWIETEREKFDNAAVLCYVKRKPDAVKVKYDFSDRVSGLRNGGQNRTLGIYPLSRLLALGASLKLIKLVYQIFPDALYHANSFRSTPIHTACAYQSNHHIVQYLVERYPEAIRLTNKHAYLPLHSACERQASIHVIRYLVGKYPEALLRKTKLGKTPLDCATDPFDSIADDAVISFLSTTLEESAGNKTLFGRRIFRNVSALLPMPQHSENFTSNAFSV
mmetsp:Transcript_19039/g.28725  ORF Transcript_19039/g.28725 Transcript_19039/m.28725 type:complete len:271 (+) Transcript_19039:51-863(+)